MKIRLAAKVQKEALHGRIYRSGTILRANARINLHHVRGNRFLFALMDAIGPAGRAELTKRQDPAQAFQILMKNDEREWDGDPKAFDEFFKSKASRR